MARHGGDCRVAGTELRGVRQPDGRMGQLPGVTQPGPERAPVRVPRWRCRGCGRTGGALPVSPAELACYLGRHSTRASDITAGLSRSHTYPCEWLRRAGPGRLLNSGMGSAELTLPCPAPSRQWLKLALLECAVCRQIV